MEIYVFLNDHFINYIIIMPVKHHFTIKIIITNSKSPKNIVTYVKWIITSTNECYYNKRNKNKNNKNNKKANHYPKKKHYQNKRKHLGYMNNEDKDKICSVSSDSVYFINNLNYTEDKKW